MSAVGVEADVSPIGGAVGQGDKEKGREIRTLEDPHTVTAVGVEADVRPTGEDGTRLVNEGGAERRAMVPRPYTRHS